MRPPSPIQIESLDVGAPKLDCTPGQTIMLTDTTSPAPATRAWRVAYAPSDEDTDDIPELTSTTDAETQITLGPSRGEGYVVELMITTYDTGETRIWRAYLRVPLADGTAVPAALVSGFELAPDPGSREREAGYMGTPDAPGLGAWCRETRARVAEAIGDLSGNAGSARAHGRTLVVSDPVSISAAGETEIYRLTIPAGSAGQMVGRSLVLLGDGSLRTSGAELQVGNLAGGADALALDGAFDFGADVPAGDGFALDFDGDDVVISYTTTDTTPLIVATIFQVDLVAWGV